MLNYVKERIQFDQKLFVERITKGGGLVLFWKNGIKVDIESSSLNYIDATINKNSEKPWKFTGFYARNPQKIQVLGPPPSITSPKLSALALC